MKNTKQVLLRSVIALLLCMSMLIGTTFAWFTDSVSVSTSIIQSGKLDVKMYWTDDLAAGEWNDVENTQNNVLFNHDKWEPGYTDVRYVKIVNTGNLALKYELTLAPVGEVGKLAEVIGVYYADGVTQNVTDRALTEMTGVGYLKDAINGKETSTGALLPENEIVVAVALKMDTAAGNEYQNSSIGDGFLLRLLVTQQTHENDGYGPDYDKDAVMPELNLSQSITTNVTTDVDGKVAAGGVTISNSESTLSAVVPEGVQLKDGTTELELTVSAIPQSGANLNIKEGETVRSLDVHIEGVAEDNTVPMIINLGKILPKGMNNGNVELFHVENGQTNAMVLVDTLTAHNQFTYNAQTGEVSVCLASFSEVVTKVLYERPWEGGVDTTWYNTTATSFTITTADELAGLRAIVAGIADGIAQDSFAGKTITLGADINLGGSEDHPWYPIGVNNAGELYAFSGTFDGGNFTIGNAWQNTWAMKGNYVYPNGDVYYDTAMGLFGLIENGTVKNLGIDGFFAEGEFCDMGCVTAYARGNCTFDNIALTNNKMYSYNCRTAGIVGYDWIGDTGSTLNFSNITIDSSNTFGALWGSWDVACAGIMGYMNASSTANITNSNISCVLDVYNDCCANYQYYQYRYSGMLIGTVGKGSTVPTEQIKCTDVTVTYGLWNQYYYCEFEKNSQASYTEDFQFSRIEKDELVYEKLEDGNTTVTGCKHTHTENENRQSYLLPFAQLCTGYGWGATAVTELEGVTFGDTLNTWHNVYFVDQSGATVAIVPFEEGADSVEEPAVPTVENAVVAWEKYTLGTEDVIVKPVVTYISGDNAQVEVQEGAGLAAGEKSEPTGTIVLAPVGGTTVIEGESSYGNDTLEGWGINGAFYGCTDLTEVVLQEGITEIGERSFAGCGGNTFTAHLPSTITTIGNYAFASYIDGNKVVTIYYEGTIASWNAINKSGSWDIKMGVGSQVICFDGTLEVTESSWLLGDPTWEQV